MANQSIKYGMPFPAYPTSLAAAPTRSSMTLDASGEKAAAIFAATEAKAIRTVHVLLGSVATGMTADVRVESVDANGDPSGTLIGTNTNAALVIADGDDSAWKSVTLTADTPTLAVGDLFAIVIVWGTGGNLQVSTFGDEAPHFPYSDHFTSAWAKDDAVPYLFPAYTDGSFEPLLGVSGQGFPQNATAFASDSTTNRRGNIFQVPFPCRAKGCWVWADADGPFTVVLYDSDGSSVLATTATQASAARAAATAGIFFLPFTAPASLAASTNYRLMVVPTSTTTLTFYDYEVPTAAMLNMFPGGTACHRSVFTSSAWIETTTARSYVGLFLDAFADDTGGGAGGSAVFPVIGPGGVIG